MNDKDRTLRKAVELAGEDFGYWDLNRIIFNGTPETMYNPDNMPQWLLDSLAAQLVRQVDALECDDGESLGVEVYPASSVMFRYQPKLSNSEPVEIAHGPDRTENTITAIVESEVLEDE